MLRSLALFALVLLMTGSPANAQCVCLKCLTLKFFTGKYLFFAMPSSSMEPGLMTGSCFTMTKYAPDDPLPLRGTVILFVHPVDGLDYIFRLIGLPGDRVQMKAGKLWLNGQEVPQIPAGKLDTLTWDLRYSREERRCGEKIGNRCITERLREELPGGASWEVLNIADSMAFDDTDEVIIPPAHVPPVTSMYWATTATIRWTAAYRIPPVAALAWSRWPGSKASLTR